MLRSALKVVFSNEFPRSPIARIPLWNLLNACWLSVRKSLLGFLKAMVMVCWPAGSVMGAFINYQVGRWLVGRFERRPGDVFFGISHARLRPMLAVVDPNLTPGGTYTLLTYGSRGGTTFASVVPPAGSGLEIDAAVRRILLQRPLRGLVRLRRRGKFALRRWSARHIGAMIICFDRRHGGNGRGGLTGRPRPAR